MRILVGIEHPKRVHVWKNPIKKLIERGHEVKIAARDKDITLELLDSIGFEYDVYGKNYSGLFKKVYGIIEGDLRLLKIAKAFNPDIFVGKGSGYMGQVSKLLNKPYICFSDTEHAKLANLLTHPFADIICTPACFKVRINPRKHVKYNGYEELAYLHPNYFTPDPSVLDELRLGKKDKFIIMRFISWGASHDIRQHGISPKMKTEYISKLEEHSEVFIVSEGELEKEFEKYKLKVVPEKFHSLLSYAQLYIGEGGSTATEAAILGTPSILISSLAKFCGNYEDLYHNYGLIYTFSDNHQALEKALNILENRFSKKKWKHRRDRMLREKIDVTQFMVECIENFVEIS
jgi:hypothetical protein